MDPISILGAVSNGFQLAQFALDILTKLITYYKDLRDAPEQSKALRDELHTFVDILNDIEESLGNTDLPPNVQRDLHNAGDLLKELDSRISPKETKGIRRLMWPIQHKQTKELIDKIKRCKSDLKLVVGTQSLLFQFQLTITDKQTWIEED